VAARRKIADESEARRCLAAAKRAGLTAGTWARARGIDGRSLRAWGLNLGRRGSGAGATAAPRALVEIIPFSPAATTGRARYVLAVADAHVEFGDDASTTTLRRIVEALRPC
jgi:hypothetical protein